MPYPCLDPRSAVDLSPRQQFPEFVSEYEALRYNFELLSLRWMPPRTDFAGTGWGMSRRQFRVLALDTVDVRCRHFTGFRYQHRYLCVSTQLS